MEPKHTHDCDKCTYLGSVKKWRASKNDYTIIDCYVCLKADSPNLHSIIGRYGSDGPEYASSHPPEAFEEKDTYLTHAESWYLFSLIEMIRRGLYTPSPIK